ncbi:MAG: hypothetical protein R2784_16745 [Saprospiraceae bacterium]
MSVLGKCADGLDLQCSTVENPPMTTDELKEFVKANPGKFTIGNDFTGMTLLKSLMIHLPEEKAHCQDHLMRKNIKSTVRNFGLHQ